MQGLGNPSGKQDSATAKAESHIVPVGGMG